MAVNHKVSGSRIRRMHCSKSIEYKERKAVFGETLAALKKARQIRRDAFNSWPSLPPVSIGSPLHMDTLKKITWQVKVIVAVLLFWKPGPCFYRSYALASVLRKRGVPLEMNLGCRNVLGINTRAKAHCWLTISGELFEEKTDPRVDYPIHAGTNQQGVHFWLGPGESSFHRP